VLQRVTFVASVELDDEGFNWETAKAAVQDVLQDGSAPHHDLRVARVILLEHVEEE
jgi:hypothetical protein